MIEINMDGNILYAVMKNNCRNPDCPTTSNVTLTVSTFLHLFVLKVLFQVACPVPSAEST